MKVEELEQTSSTYSFNITHCPYYEKDKELDLLEYGVALSCCHDVAFVRGLNTLKQ